MHRGPNDGFLAEAERVECGRMIAIERLNLIAVFDAVYLPHFPVIELGKAKRLCEEDRSGSHLKAAIDGSTTLGEDFARSAIQTEYATVEHGH
jgi:hypothetical protein